MNLTSLSQIINQSFQAVGYINSIYTGDVYDRWNNSEVRYMSACYTLETIESTDDISTYGLIIYAADRLMEDQSNTAQCFDTCQQAIEMLFRNVVNIGGDDIFIEDIRSYTPFTQKFCDNLAGVYVRTKIKTKNIISTCP